MYPPGGLDALLLIILNHTVTKVVGVWIAQHLVYEHVPCKGQAPNL